MNNYQSPLPDRGSLAELEAEIRADSERGRAAIAKATSPEWSWNEAVYRDMQGTHRPESSTRTEQFGLELAGRTARNSWQQNMSPQGEPLSPFGSPLELLTRSQVLQLRARARTAKGRRQLQLLVGALRDAELSS